ncbi:MAG: N-formylglutamate amidohydrolase [Pseudomonadota bacterium]|jgi:predicted N-formylglutamate amidohydrolase
MANGTDRFLITCEHGGNRVPPRYRHFFRGHEELLQTHRGYDAGALAMAKELADALAAPLFVSTISRLLIDLNRSPGHPRLYSEATRSVPTAVLREIMERYYLPYRNKAEASIAAAVASGGRVIHISSHSFTPELDGEVRNADIGLLYDPARAGEAALCNCWQVFLKALAPGLKVRRNYPYTGKSDGFTAYLRRRFPADRYVGIELEISQKYALTGGRQWRKLRATVIEALRQALADESHGNVKQEPTAARIA